MPKRTKTPQTKILECIRKREEMLGTKIEHVILKAPLCIGYTEKVTSASFKSLVDELEGYRLKKDRLWDGKDVNYEVFLYTNLRDLEAVEQWKKENDILLCALEKEGRLIIADSDGAWRREQDRSKIDRLYTAYIDSIQEVPEGQSTLSKLIAPAAEDFAKKHEGWTKEASTCYIAEEIKDILSWGDTTQDTVSILFYPKKLPHWAGFAIAHAKDMGFENKIESVTYTLEPVHSHENGKEKKIYPGSHSTLFSLPPVSPKVPRELFSEGEEIVVREAFRAAFSILLEDKDHDVHHVVLKDAEHAGEVTYKFLSGFLGKQFLGRSVFQPTQTQSSTQRNSSQSPSTLKAIA